MMGHIKFQVASPEMISATRLKHAYAVDALLVSYSVDASIEEDVVTLELPSNESCQCFFSWPLASGELMLCTTSLRISEMPYDYELELARGTVGRLLAKFADWAALKIEFSEKLMELVSQAKANLIEAVFQAEASDRAEAAFMAIDLAIESMQLLVEEYVSHLGPRESSWPHLKYGVIRRTPQSKQPPPKAGLSSTDTATLHVDDTLQLSAKTDHRYVASSALASQLDALFLPSPEFRLDTNISQELLKIASLTQKLFKGIDFAPGPAAPHPRPTLTLGIGPILDWCSPAIEQFLRTEIDFEQMRDNLYMLSKAVVENLPKPVNAFYVAAGVGARGVKEFSDHQRLQLTLDAMCGIYKSAPDLPLLVSFHQPIGYEIDNAPQAISCLHGADALIRADAGLQMIGLEITFAGDDFPSTRELLQLNELLDVWSDFGLPLFVVIKLAPMFALCRPQLQVAGRQMEQVGSRSRERLFSDSAASSPRRSALPAFDYSELRRIVALLQSKPVVHSLFFSAPGLRADAKPVSSPPGQLSFEDIVSRVISESKSSLT